MKSTASPLYVELSKLSREDLVALATNPGTDPDHLCVAQQILFEEFGVNPAHLKKHVMTAA